MLPAWSIRNVRSRALRVTVLGTTLAAVAACGGTSEPAVPPKDVIPVTITPTSTDSLRGVVGGPVNSVLTVTVKNKAGEPIDSATVTFAVATGSGTLDPTNARTNSAGEAKTTWTFGPGVGVQTVTATVGGLAPVVFTGVATASTASNLAKLAGDAQSGTVGTNVPVAPSVKVTDKFGNAVPGAVVAFSAATGGGLVNPGQVTTGADGIATVASWRLGTTAGANTLVATIGALSVTFTATSAGGAAATLTLTPPGPAALGLGGTVTLTTRVTDANGNVLANAPVTFTSSNANVASVTSVGVITATGPGTATITAASGSALGTFAVTVTGHPAGNGINKTITPATLPGALDVAFTKNAMFISASGLMKIFTLDAEANTPGPDVNLTSGASILLAGTKSTGPLLAVNVAVTSRVWFVNPATAAVIDSLDILDIVNSGVIKSDGSMAYFLLSGGEVQPVDVVAHRLLPRISLGGIPTKMRLDQGDTLAYVNTTVGSMFEIDTRTNTVRRQINLGTPGAISPDFAISADGNSLYLLDSFNSTVRISDLATGVIQRIVGILPSAITIALSPDNQQIWITHGTQVSIYNGSLATGFLAGPVIPTMSLPLRIYFSPTGSFAAITNIGGWVDIVR